MCGLTYVSQAVRVFKNSVACNGDLFFWLYFFVYFLSRLQTPVLIRITCLPLAYKNSRRSERNVYNGTFWQNGLYVTFLIFLGRFFILQKKFIFHRGMVIFFIFATKNAIIVAVYRLKLRENIPLSTVNCNGGWVSYEDPYIMWIIFT